MSKVKKILEEAIRLEPNQRVQLVDQLILSLDKPDKELDEIWSKEAESRLDAYKRGELKAISLEEVLSKFQ